MTYDHNTPDWRSYYDSVPAPSYDPFKASREHYGIPTPERISAQVEVTFQDVSYEFMALLMGYSSVEEMRQAAQQREQLQQMARFWARTGGSGYRWAYSSARGHGKVATARAVLAWQKAVSRAREVAGIRGVRWVCPKPAPSSAPDPYMQYVLETTLPINHPKRRITVN